MSLVLRIALRTLSRNRWRSVLTAGGVAMAVAFIVWVVHMSNGMYDQMVASVTDAELGDIQIHATAYVEEQNLYNALDASSVDLEAIRGLDTVAGAAGRVQAFGLVGHEKHSLIARIIGIDVAAERAVTSTHASISSGEWLSEAPEAPPAPREIVVGAGLARQLSVGVGDELVVFLQAADGSLGNDLLKIRGVATTGNSSLDRMAVWMHIEDVQYLTALHGRYHEVAIALERGVDVEEGQRQVTAIAGSEELAVRSWQEILPDVYGLIKLSESSMWIFYVIIYFIAALGILNAQRMAALERRREFGVLLAIGTSPRRMVAQVVAESVVLTLAGAVVGAILGTLVCWYHQEVGFQFAADGETFQYMGVELGTIWFQLSLVDILMPLLHLAVVGLLCGLWPAISSARLDMPRAIAGRT